MASSQSSFDSSVVVAPPPEDLKSSFPSPRLRHGSSSSKQQKNRNRSSSTYKEMPDESSMETIEQRYLRQRIQDRPPHNPNQAKDLQMKSILLKSMSPPAAEDGQRLVDFEREEERVRQEALLKLNNSESDISVLTEAGPSRLSVSNLHTHMLNGRGSPVGSRRTLDTNSLDSRRFESDSLDSGRGEALTDVKGKADYKAAKKIEWLENYLELCAKKNIPLDSPEMVKSKGILGKFKSSAEKAEKAAAAAQMEGGGGGGRSNSIQDTSAGLVKHITPTSSAPPEGGGGSDTSLPESKRDPGSASASASASGPTRTPELLVEPGEVTTLKEQLADANREIDKLRLERALLHAQKEIKKLKTELTYSREIENEDNNIDNIFRNKSSPNPPPISFTPNASPAITTPTTGPPPSTSISSALPGAQTTPATTSTLSPSPPTGDGTPPPLSLDNLPAAKRKTKRNTTRLTTRMSKIGGLKGGGAGSRWSTIAKELSSKGSEAFLEEDEIEAYREEKRRKKKKKKFMDDIEDVLPTISSTKKEVNPLIKKQIQSFEFLNFLDSLDGLDGNTPQKSA